MAADLATLSRLLAEVVEGVWADVFVCVCLCLSIFVWVENARCVIRRKITERKRVKSNSN